MSLDNLHESCAGRKVSSNFDSVLIQIQDWDDPFLQATLVDVAHCSGAMVWSGPGRLRPGLKPFFLLRFSRA